MSKQGLKALCCRRRWNPASGRVCFRGNPGNAFGGRVPPFLGTLNGFRTGLALAGRKMMMAAWIVALSGFVRC
jgi:hypothetical protein